MERLSSSSTTASEPVENITSGSFSQQSRSSALSLKLSRSSPKTPETWDELSRPAALNDPNHSESRIPLALQAVFLASNRGDDVPQAPKDRSAFKVFRRFFRGGKSQKGQRGTSKQKGRTLAQRLFHRRREPRKRTTNASDMSETEHLEDDEKVSPQEYLDSLIYSRGYSTRRHSTLQSAYFNRPTPLQEASYHSHMIQLVRKGNPDTLRAHLQCGLSPSPANSYGESLLHTVCRLGRSRMLQTMIDSGADVRIANEHGRTPLHDACSASSFEAFEIVCEQDVRMLYAADKHNFCPLQLVPKNNWNEWISFLEAKKDEYWPAGRFAAGHEEPPPFLTLKRPNSRPARDPPNALSFEVAARVASGVLPPEEAQNEMKRLLEEIKLRSRAIATNFDALEEALMELSTADADNDTDNSDLTDSDDDEEASVSVSDVSDSESDEESSLGSLDVEGIAEAMGVLGILPR